MRYHNYHNNEKLRTVPIEESLSKRVRNEMTDEQYIQKFIDAFKEKAQSDELPASQAEVLRDNEDSSVRFALPHRLPLG